MYTHSKDYRCGIGQGNNKSPHRYSASAVLYTADFFLTLGYRHPVGKFKFGRNHNNFKPSNS